MYQKMKIKFLETGTRNNNSRLSDVIQRSLIHPRILIISYLQLNMINHTKYFRFVEQTARQLYIGNSIGANCRAICENVNRFVYSIRRITSGLLILCRFCIQT